MISAVFPAWSSCQCVTSVSNYFFLYPLRSSHENMDLLWLSPLSTRSAFPFWSVIIVASPVFFAPRSIAVMIILLLPASAVSFKLHANTGMITASARKCRNALLLLLVRFSVVFIVISFLTCLNNASGKYANYYYRTTDHTHFSYFAIRKCFGPSLDQCSAKAHAMLISDLTSQVSYTNALS